MSTAVFRDLIQSVCIKKILLESAVNGKCIESGDRSFGQTKFVKNFSYEKFVCKIPNIDNL